MNLFDAIRIVENHDPRLDNWIDEETPCNVWIECEKPWTGSSKILIAPITDDRIINSKPEYDYFLPVFLIKELIEDLESKKPRLDFDELVKRIIHFAKFDA